MQKRCIIVANGQLYPEIIPEIHATDYVIGVDKAAYWLLANGITPDVAIGDFDSVTAEELVQIKKNIPNVVDYIAEKDWTDTELAFDYALKTKPDAIVIFGGSGSRLDHTLGVFFLLERARKRGIPAVFRNATNEVQLISRGRTILKKREGYQYISIVPITQSITISLHKFKYALNKRIIHRGQTLGISNEFTGMTADVTLFAGSAFAIQSKD